MPIRKRAVVIAGIAILALALYGTAKYFSPVLVLHVVEQSLEQKAPSETDPVFIQERLHTLLSTVPDQNAQLEKLLQISAYLEKVQRLTTEELDELLAADRPGTPPVL